jgi:hypothetical protein
MTALREDRKSIAAAPAAPSQDPAVRVGAADPFVRRMRRYASEIAAYNAGEDDDDIEPGGVLCAEIREGSLVIQSPAGAALALRRVIDLDVVGDTEAECLIGAVVTFLEGRAA